MCVLQGVIGELVWAQGDGVCCWPAIISKCVEDGKMTVEWYGQRMSSQVRRVSPQVIVIWKTLF